MVLHHHSVRLFTTILVFLIASPAAAIDLEIKEIFPGHEFDFSGGDGTDDARAKDLFSWDEDKTSSLDLVVGENAPDDSVSFQYTVPTRKWASIGVSLDLDGVPPFDPASASLTIEATWSIASSDFQGDELEVCGVNVMSQDVFSCNRDRCDVAEEPIVIKIGDLTGKIDEEADELDLIFDYFDGDGQNHLGFFEDVALTVTRFSLDLGPLSADFDKDGTVDGDDFLIWQLNFGTLAGATSNSGDTDNDGDVDGDDFLAWQLQFARSRQVPALVPRAVPEPVTFCLGLLSGLGFLAGRACRPF